MKYTQKDLFKIASQIEAIEDEGNAVDIKVKKGIEPEQFKSALVALGVPAEIFDTSTLPYTHTHKDWTYSVLARYNAPEVWAFLGELETQVKRIGFIDKLYRACGALNGEEIKYMQGLAVRDAAAMMTDRIKK